MIYSNDHADAAGGCDADGAALLAAMGFDGPQPPPQAPVPPAVRREAASPAKGKVSLAFVLFWELAGTDDLGSAGLTAIWDRQSRRGEGSEPDERWRGSKPGERWRGSEPGPGERWRGSEPGERWTCRGTSFAIYGSRVIFQSQAERGVVSFPPGADVATSFSAGPACGATPRAPRRWP